MVRRIVLPVLVLLCLGLGAGWWFALTHTSSPSVPPLPPEKPAIFAQIGHSFDVASIAFSPDGRLLASGSFDKTIKLWDVSSRRLLRTLNTPDLVSSVAFSPDGTLVAANDKKTVDLWSATTGHLWHKLAGSDAEIFRVAFARGGRVLAASDRNGTVRLWDVASGRVVQSIGGSLGPIALSASGNLMAGVGPDHAFTLWDTSSGHVLHELADHFDTLGSIAFSPDGAVVASANSGKSVEIWDTRTGRLSHTLTKADVTDVAFSPDGKTFATAGVDDIVQFWSTADWSPLRSIKNDGGTLSEIAFSPDSKLFAAGGSGTSVDLRDAATGAEVGKLNGRASAVNSVALSPDGRVLAVGSGNNAIVLWDTSSGEKLRLLVGHSDAVNSVAFAPDGKTLASGSEDHTAVLWDVANGRRLRTFAGHESRIRSVALNPDGKTLATGSDDFTLKLWSAATGAERRTLGGDAWVVSSVAFSSDHRTVAAGTWDGKIELWATQTGQLIRTLSANSDTTEDRVDAIAFSPNGKLLASGSWGHTVDLFNVATGKQLGRLRGHDENVYTVAFSYDGKILASGSLDNTARLWDVATQRQIRVLDGHTGAVRSVAFSKDGKLLATGSDDGTTRIWAVATGRELASLIANDDGSSIAVTPAGFFDSSSEEAEEGLNLRIDNRVFGISSVRDNFYRPDLVKRALAGGDVSQFGSIDRVKLSPVVEFANIPNESSHRELAMTLRLTNGGGGFGPVRLFWNGTVIAQDSAIPAGGPSLVRRYSVPLLAGENDLRATAFNADGSMWSDVRTSVVANLPVARAAGAHGTLHAIVVGIQTFPRAKQHNLKFPVADAGLIADRLRRHAAPLFDKLDIQLFTSPEETDKTSLVKALKAMSSTAAADDEFILYVASHGIVYDGQYYLVTSDVDPTNPASLERQAIGARELSDLLANVPAARKLVILDTCDAGAASAVLKNNGGQTAQTTATILGRDYGLTVLAAANSNEEALEGYKDHGLFSFVTADGLGGQAADSTTGIVDSFVLANYVKGRVPVLAETLSAKRRTQQPTAETSGRSFPVTKVK